MDQNVIPESSYNLQTDSRAILSIPIQNVLGRHAKLNDFCLNIYRFNTPELTTVTNEVKHNGFNIPIPAGVRRNEQEMDVDFNVSNNIIQYAALYAWIVKFANMYGEYDQLNGTDTVVDPLAPVMLSDTVPGELTLLDEYLKPVTNFKYSGMWIQRLGRLKFDQTEQGGKILTCSATIKYFDFDFDYKTLLGD